MRYLLLFIGSVALAASVLLAGCSEKEGDAAAGEEGQSETSRVSQLAESDIPKPEGNWQEFSLQLTDSVWASSELTETSGGAERVYSAENMFDGNRSTCWAEGAPGGTGESVTFIADRPVARVGIVNGYARDQEIYQKNNRVAKMSVSVFPAFTAPGLVTENDWYLYYGLEYPAGGVVELADTMETQYFDFPLSVEQQPAIMRDAMNRFLSDHPQFATAIEKDLGLEKFHELSESGREEYRRLVRAAFSMYCVRFQVTEVHPGDSYDDTCVSEVEMEFP
jgi:hypothetical protein